MQVDNPDVPSNEITPHQQNLILEAVQGKGASRPCYRCGNQTHTVHNSLTNVPMNGVTAAAAFTATSIPAAIIFCSNCGLVSFHALGYLGLLQHPAFGYKVSTK